MKVLITGSPGIGKSTVIHELQKLGMTAYDTDEMPDVSRLEIKATGEPVEWPTGVIDWDKYGWHWQKEPLETLLNSGEDVYIGAIMSNQHKFYDMFDLIIGLYIDEEKHLQRLQSRPEREFNNSDEAHARIIKKAQQKRQLFADAGAIMIDNSGPVAEVAQHIIEVCDERRSNN